MTTDRRRSETAQSELLYTKIAARYDVVFERAILAEGRLTQVLRQLLSGRSVLDLACGNGRWLSRFRPGAYMGIDLNGPILRQARHRYPNASFVQADMTNIPLPDGSFEGVISMFGAMGHLPYTAQEAMIREVHRVLKPGGIAIVTNGNLWSPFGLPTTVTGGRVRIEGVRVRVHSATPRGFSRLLSDFRLLRLESYDFSYIPLLPLKFIACLAGKDYRPLYGGCMDLLDHCRYIPTIRWFGKQLLAVCQKA